MFALRAKGRSAEVISGQLFISAHTVKTHTSRIYRKLSINSQQEPIDLAEEGRTVGKQ
ncbi:MULTISPECIES: helix-turn-helix transcriptional regulator [Gordonibacter]|uniref:helix-turn-helix transcriptional regulator n=1 Tax=Gordonibacter TaxID=644652 RepID=UPI001D79D246|nr:LuxR C-terminal-related transcriptional regulator [Gordonibacter sp. RACS_AR49]HJF63614.1 LuxR C-terminal-related transcriptional regulator [Gordonibacter urolithinfaciens]